MLMIFLSAFSVGFSGAVMPGPLLTYTIRKALVKGPWAGAVIIAGHAMLELLLVAVIFLGFDTVLKSDKVQAAIGLAGGIMLVLMGTGMIRGAIKNKVSPQTDPGKNDSGNMIISSVILTASNPYFIIWWAIIGLGFLMQSYESHGIAGIAVYYLGHAAADFSWYIFVSAAVGTTRKFLNEKIYRILIACLGCVLVFFGARFIYGAISALM